MVIPRYKSTSTSSDAPPPSTRGDTIKSDIYSAPIIPPLGNDTSLRPSRPPRGDEAVSAKFLAELSREKPSMTETYMAYGATELLYNECGRQAEYTRIPPDVNAADDSPIKLAKTANGIDLGEGSTWWHTHLGLTPTYNTWSQVTMLHLWLIASRIRQFPKVHSPVWQRQMVDHFFFDAEQKMVIYHAMTARSVRNRHLKDLFTCYRGLLVAYDEGVVKGDAVLAAALWRNIWGGCGATDGEMDINKLTEVVAYVRREMKYLEGLKDEEIAGGLVKLGGRTKKEKGTQLAEMVAKRSSLTDEPFRDDDFGEEK